MHALVNPAFDQENATSMGCAAPGLGEHDTNASSFGAYVRAVRTRAGVGLTEMASRVGVSLGHYYRIEFDEKAPLDSTRWGPLIEMGADAAALARFEQRDRAKRKPRGRPRSRVAGVSPGEPGSPSWDTLSWEQDDWCWYAVTCHPNGLSLEQVGALLGCGPELVRKIELEALAKLALEPGAVEAMEIVDDRDTELAIWTVAASEG
jgi:hypothetical protein